MAEENIVGDFEPADAITAGDLGLDEIDWDRVAALQGAYDVVLNIQDETERLEAAKQLVEKLNVG